MEKTDEENFFHEIKDGDLDKYVSAGNFYYIDSWTFAEVRKNYQHNYRELQ